MSMKKSNRHLFGRMNENIKCDFSKRLENADDKEVLIDMHRAAGLLRGE